MPEGLIERKHIIKIRRKNTDNQWKYLSVTSHLHWSHKFAQRFADGVAAQIVDYLRAECPWLQVKCTAVVK
jgi:hypothetical protein